MPLLRFGFVMMLLAAAATATPMTYSGMDHKLCADSWECGLAQHDQVSMMNETLVPTFEKQPDLLARIEDLAFACLVEGGCLSQASILNLLTAGLALPEAP